MLDTVNSGDMTWILICSVLVFLMVPGFAFLYGGLFPKKSLFTILTFCFTVICLISLQWVLFGYSLAFGPDHNGWIGTLAWAGLRGVGADPNLEHAGTISHQAFMMYQLAVATLAPVIFLSPLVERLKTNSLCIFAFLWAALIYDPVAHWLWGVGGFLRNAGASDFSGGAVLHLTAGMSALAMILVLGKPTDGSPLRRESGDPSTAALGAAMLWLGWFGLNGGHVLSAGPLSSDVFIVTQLSAAAAGLTWSLLDGLIHQKLSPLGLVTGVVAGLVAVSPAAGFVGIWAAIGIGIGGAIYSYAALALLEKKFGYNDSFYVLAVHGVGGIWGMIATGFWATKNINPAGPDGFFYGHPIQLLIQLKAILAISIFVFGTSYIILKMMDLIIGLRIPERSERSL